MTENPDITHSNTLNTQTRASLQLFDLFGQQLIKATQSVCKFQRHANLIRTLCKCTAFVKLYVHDTHNTTHTCYYITILNTRFCITTLHIRVSVKPNYSHVLQHVYNHSSHISSYITTQRTRVTI